MATPPGEAAGQPSPLIVETGASARVVNALAKVGIHDLGTLCIRTLSQVQAMPNLGAVSIKEIQEILGRYEMTLAPEGTATSWLKAATPVRNEGLRIADIIARRGNGETLAQIGQAHGITRERVRQILHGAELLVAEQRRARVARDREAVLERRDEVLAAFRQGDNPRQVAAVYGLREQAVKELIDAEASDLDRAARRAARSRTPEYRYSDDDLLAAIREVAGRYGRVPSSGEYAAAAAGGMLPSLPTIHNRLGWSNAVELAGFSPRRGNHREYTRRWTAPACRAALIRLVLESGHVPTVQEYDQLAELDPDLPSYGTVRHRLGPWSSVTADLVRLPTPADALSRCLDGSVDRRPDSGEIWLGYLEERISEDDIIVLAIDHDFSWSSEFGEAPDWLVPLVPSDPGPERAHP